MVAIRMKGIVTPEFHTYLAISGNMSKYLVQRIEKRSKNTAVIMI
jgi:hypothetical protein